MRRHVGYWFEAITRGFPSLVYVSGLLTLAIGGSVAVVVLWGKDHIVWSVVILLSALVVLLGEGAAAIGRERDNAKDAAQRSSAATRPARGKTTGFRSRDSEVTYINSSAIGQDIGFDNEGGVVRHHGSTALDQGTVDAALRRAHERADN